MVGALTCVFPTDRTPQVSVQVTGLPDVLVVGDSFRAAVLAVDGAGRAVPNAEARFHGSADSILAVWPDGAVKALAAGTALVVGQLQGYAGVEGSREVRVRGVVEIDSVSPDTVRFGDTLTVYGVAAHLDSAVVFVGDIPAPVKRVEWADSGHRAGKVIAWVPVHAPPSATVSLGVGAAASTAAQGITVIQQDLYEPNDYSAPYDLGTLPGGFFNPELAFERQSVQYSPSTDMYTVRTDARQTRTLTYTDDIEVNPTIGLLTGGVRSSTSLAPRSYLSPRLGWLASYGSVCVLGGGYAGQATVIIEIPASDTTRLVLARLPATGTLVISAESRQRDRRYALRIENGYDGPLAPDSAEYNDTCDTARQLTYGGGVHHFNFHAPFDIDWFYLPAPPVDTVVRIRAEFPGPGLVRMAVFASYGQVGGGIGDATFTEMYTRIGNTSGYFAVYPFYPFAVGPMPYTLSVSYSTTAALEAWRTRLAAASGTGAGSR